MKITVNERPVGTSATEETTLGALLDELRRRGEIRADQVVVGLTAEGRRWGAEDFQVQLGAPLQGIGRLEIDTDDLKGYGRRILTDAASMLTVMTTGAAEIALQFRAGTPQEASSNLYNLLDSLQRFFFCLFQVKNICLPEVPGSILAGPANEQLSAALDQVRTCQELEEWDALADRIDDGLVPALQGLQAVVTRLEGAF